MGDHEFRPGVIGRWSDEVTFAVRREHTVAYAEATNDEIAPHRDGILAPPVFAVVPPFALLADTTMSAVPDELLPTILHGEQDIRFHRPLRPGDDVVSRAKVAGVHGRSSGVVVTTLAETRTTDGERLSEQYFTGFFRGGRWSRADGEPAPDHAFDEALRSRAPDAEIRRAFDADQTFRYAEASGDPMPIHTDDDFARRMGLPGIIVHGLCTMAFTSHAVIGHACPEDPARLRRLAVRFSSPAFPHNTIGTALWRAGRGRYAFEARTEDGTVVIKDGLAVVAS
jgi:acyl dehydratase